MPQYVWFGLSSALGQTFNLEAAGAALLVGLAAWVGWHLHSLWRDNPALIGLFAAAVAFYVVAGLGRDTTAGATTVVSRYVYVGIAILLPLIAKVLSSLTVWPAGRWAVVGVLGVTALGNVGQAQTWVIQPGRTRVELEARTLGDGAPAGVRRAPMCRDLELPRSGCSLTCRRPASTIWSALASYRSRPAHTCWQLINARGLLAVGTWAGGKTAALRRGAFPGPFRFHQCIPFGCLAATQWVLDLAPETIKPTIQVRLRLLAWPEGGLGTGCIPLRRRPG